MWLLGGCGRVGFDPGARLDALYGSDGGVAICTAVPEVCNGIDDDCNGIIDEGCGCVPFDTTIPVATAIYNGMMWTGSSYLVLVDDGTTFALQEISPDGAIASRGDLNPTSATSFGTHPIAWDGTTAYVTWTQDTKKVMARRFDRHANAIGAAIQVSTTTAGDAPTIGVVPDGIVVAWSDTRSGNPIVYLQRLGLDGTLRGAEIAAVSGSVDTLVAGTDGYVMVVTDGSNLLPGRTVLLGLDGALLGSHVPMYGSKIGRDATLAIGNPLTVTWQVINDVDWWVEPFGEDGAASGNAVVVPRYNAHANLLETVAGSPAGHTVFVLTSALPAEVVRLDYDPSFGLVAGPTLVSLSSASAFGELQAIVSDHRQSVLVPAAGQARLIQQCM